MVKEIIITSALLVSSLKIQANSVPSGELLRQKECLSTIIYSESRGEPKTGQLAVAHASINRAVKTTGSTCNIRGVTRKKIPKQDKTYFIKLAEYALFHKSTIASADSWNTGKKPHSRGKAVKSIGAHVFYIMASL